MTGLAPFEEVEKLLLDSVFHPSPCKRLRERVLQNAAQARNRQKLWRRLFAASSAATGTLLAVFLVIRVFGHASGEHTQPGPVRVQVYSPGRTLDAADAPQPARAPAASLGEEYFRQAGLKNDVRSNPADERPVISETAAH